MSKLHLESVLVSLDVFCSYFPERLKYYSATPNALSTSTACLDPRIKGLIVQLECL